MQCAVGQSKGKVGRTRELDSFIHRDQVGKRPEGKVAVLLNCSRRTRPICVSAKTPTAARLRTIVDYMHRPIYPLLDLMYRSPSGQ